MKKVDLCIDSFRHASRRTANQGGTFALYTMIYSKTPLDYNSIIEMMKSRGLIIADEQKAINYLKVISYFRLANYLRPMEKDKETHLYKPNSYFDNAIDLYYFDKELRSIIFSAVQSIEIALRSKMIHHISLKYGAFWYMDASLFKDDNIFHQCLTLMKQELARSKEDFITEHKAKYTEPDMPPVWKTLEVTSFGTLSKLFCNLKDNSVKKIIAREFNLPQHLILESWVKCAVNLRNCLAHHARVWNRNYPTMPQLNGSFRGNWIKNTNLSMVKLYPQLCYLEYIHNQIHSNSNFKKRLDALLKEHPNVDIAAMGFPKDWKNEPLWK